MEARGPIADVRAGTQPRSPQLSSDGEPCCQVYTRSSPTQGTPQGHDLYQSSVLGTLLSFCSGHFIVDFGGYRYLRISANLIFCVKNAAQPTYGKHMGVRIKGGRGQASFTHVPEMLTFTEDAVAGMVPNPTSPREQAHSPQFPPSARHKFNLNYASWYTFICL